MNESNNNRTPANKCGVTCEWLESRHALVNPDGQVVPCCYIANVLYMVQMWEGNQPEGISRQIGNNAIIKKEFHDEPVLREYWENKEQFNVFNRPLGEILGSDWFTKTLPESWDDDSRLVWQCRKKCTRDDSTV